jgi:hypothetical protein
MFYHKIKKKKGIYNKKKLHIFNNNTCQKYLKKKRIFKRLAYIQNNLIKTAE